MPLILLISRLLRTFPKKYLPEDLISKVPFVEGVFHAHKVQELISALLRKSRLSSCQTCKIWWRSAEVFRKLMSVFWEHDCCHFSYIRSVSSGGIHRTFLCLPQKTVLKLTAVKIMCAFYFILNENYYKL